MGKYPRVVIDLKKIKENTEAVVKICSEKNITVTGVTKSFCGDPLITKAMVDGGVTELGDSRLDNLERLKDFTLPKILLRLPMKSHAHKVVEIADISLNSELSTIKALDEAAALQNKKHGIILMAELGDLREGILPLEYNKIMDEIKKLENIEFKGLGVNLTCYGGVLPSFFNMNKLSKIAENIREKFDMHSEVISGGNSSTLHLLESEDFPESINNLRIGEAILLGKETAYGNRIEETYSDTFILQAEIVELKQKPTLPEGEIGNDAFGNKPNFEDIGLRKRAILAIGKQDIDDDGIYPTDSKVTVFGASSDHLIVDVTDSRYPYKVGDIISFTLNYPSLLKVMTSRYVKKNYLLYKKG